MSFLIISIILFAAGTISFLHNFFIDRKKTRMRHAILDNLAISGLLYFYGIVFLILFFNIHI